MAALKVTVQKLSGEAAELSLALEGEGTLVRHLLAEAAQVFGLSPSSVRLVSGSSVLRPQASLEEADVKDGATLTLIASKASLALTASHDGSAKLWEAETGACAQTFGEHGNLPVLSAAFSPDGATVLTAAGSVLRLWSVSTGECQQVLQVHDPHELVRMAVFLPSGEDVLSCSDDGTARVTRLESEECLQTLRGHTRPVVSVACSPDGALALTAARDLRVRLWRMSTGECLRVLPGRGHGTEPSPSAPSFSEDGHLALFLCEDNIAALCSVKTGALVQFFETRGAGMMFVATFSPDSKLILTVSQTGEVRLWSRRTGECVRRFVVSGATVRSATCSADSSLVLTASFDGTAKLWDARTGELRQVFRGHDDRLMTGVLWG